MWCRRHVLLSVVVGVSLTLSVSLASAYQERGGERLNNTAYTLPAWELSLGLWRAQVGVLDEVLLGTYVPTWFTYPFLQTTVPTGFVKVRDWFHADVAVSLRAGFVFFSGDTLAQKLLDDANVQAGMAVFPIGVATSWRANRWFSQSLEASYVFAAAGGESDGRAKLEGGMATENVTLTSLSEWRVSRVVALTLLGRFLAYRGNARLEGTIEEDGSEIEVDVGGRFENTVAFSVVPGVSLSFEYVNLELGIGYGNWWLPIVEMPLPGRTLVPEFDIYVRF